MADTQLDPWQLISSVNWPRGGKILVVEFHSHNVRPSVAPSRIGATISDIAGLPELSLTEGFRIPSGIIPIEDNFTAQMLAFYKTWSYPPYLATGIIPGGETVQRFNDVGAIVFFNLKKFPSDEFNFTLDIDDGAWPFPPTHIGYQVSLFDKRNTFEVDGQNNLDTPEFRQLDSAGQSFNGVAAGGAHSIDIAVNLILNSISVS